MPFVSEVCGFLDELAPPELAENWDNVGLLIGRTSSRVNRILTCLTLTPDVAEEAVEQHAELIVAHVPSRPRAPRAVPRRSCNTESRSRVSALSEKRMLALPNHNVRWHGQNSVAGRRA